MLVVDLREAIGNSSRPALIVPGLLGADTPARSNDTNTYHYMMSGTGAELGPERRSSMSAAGSRPSRKRGRPTAAERDERREQILDAAVGLFVSRGYGHVTIDEIAAASRVTKRTIYTYLGDKADVFTAVIERFRARALADLGSDSLTLPELAARLVFVLHADDAVGLHRLVIGEAAQFPEVAAQFYASGPRGYVELLETQLPERSTGPGREQLAEALFGLLLGEAHRRRLLGLAPAPTPAAAREHALAALSLLGITGAGPAG
jgi:TetR/AcrR family transcriptional regulator, mexJK operon transcriptional repressor